MTRDEAFKEYEEILAKIDKQSHEARAEARAILQERLNVIRIALHEELRVIRAIQQKTKRSK